MKKLLTATIKVVFAVLVFAVFSLVMQPAHSATMNMGASSSEISMASPTPSPVYPNLNSGSYPHLAVRKNVEDLTKQEKAAFVHAIKTLKNTYTPGSKVSVYDQLTNVHVETLGFTPGDGPPLSSYPTGPATGASPAHDKPAFLAWHRQNLLQFEKALQTVDPSVTVPYWDWTSPNALKVVFADDFLGPKGTGETVKIPGKGDFQGGTVKSGFFSEAEGWVLNKDINVDAMTGESRGTSLTRFMRIPPFDQYPLSQEYIDRILSTNDYLTLCNLLEGWGVEDDKGNITPDWNAHNYIHALVGGAVLKDPNKPRTLDNWSKVLGTMNNLPSSSYDPAFWLNHANLDRLWAEWQDNGHTGSAFYPASGQHYGHNLHDRMWPWDGGKSTPGNIGSGNQVSLLPHFAPDYIVTPADVLDFRQLGYTYDTLPQVLVAESGSHESSTEGHSRMSQSP